MRSRQFCASIVSAVSLSAAAASEAASAPAQSISPAASVSVLVAPMSAAVAPTGVHAATPAALPSSAAIQPQIVVNVPKPAAAPWYLDVGKTLIGTFLGAVLAFLSAIAHRRAQQRKSDITAGNMALFQLRAMHRQTTEMRLGVRAEIKMAFDTYGKVPEWCILRPSINVPDEGIELDFGSLSFLTDSVQGQKALLEARHVQELYKLSCHAFDRQQQASIAYQAKLQDVSNLDGVVVDGLLNWAVLEEKLGAVLVASRRSYFWAHLRNLEVNPSINRRAFAALQTELLKRFGDKAWNLQLDPPPSDNRAEGNLPALPADIGTYINEQRDFEQRVRSESDVGRAS